MFFMIIHINPTLQSYLVPEKKMIYFLKHATATSGNVVVFVATRRCVRSPFVAGASRAQSKSVREAAVGGLTALRHKSSSAPGCSKQ